MNYAGKDFTWDCNESGNSSITTHYLHVIIHMLKPGLYSPRLLGCTKNANKCRPACIPFFLNIQCVQCSINNETSRHWSERCGKSLYCNILCKYTFLKEHVWKHFSEEWPLASLLTKNLDVTIFMMLKFCVVLLVQLYKI